MRGNTGQPGRSSLAALLVLAAVAFAAILALPHAAAVATAGVGGIDVVKVADSTAVSAGDQIGFTVDLSETGGIEADDLQFSDPLPTGGGDLTWSISPASAGWSISNGNLVYSPTTLGAGALTSVHVIAVTSKADCGTVLNTATVTTSNDGSDQATAFVAVNCAAIHVTKTADAPDISAGDQAGYQVTLSNTGSGEAHGVSFSDPLPQGGGNLSWSISPASAGWSISNGNLVYSPTTLTAGASTNVHVVATTGAADCGTLLNTATVTTSNDGSDQASASVAVHCADIHVTKTADASDVSAGDQIGFTVTLSNTSAGDAHGLSFLDVLPTGGGNLAWSISPASAGWSISNGNLVYSPTTLAGGALTSAHVIATTSKADCGRIANTAAVTTSDEGSDQASAYVDVHCAAIHVSKTADATDVSAGDQAGYAVTLSNTGTGTAKGVNFTDPLPQGGGNLTWSISPASAGWSISNGNLVYAPATLAAGAVTSVHVIAITSKNDCGTLLNTATVTTSNDGSDQSSASVAVHCASIHVTKVADSSDVNAGGQAGYTVTLSNTGAGTAKGISFTDPLPVGGGNLTWSISPASAGWSISNGNLVYAPTTLVGGAVTSVHVIATTGRADCGTLLNTATVTASNDGSDQSSASVHVNCPPNANAGPDQTVDTGATVHLDGTGSSDPEGDALIYTWTQTSGPIVTVSGANTATPSFTAPAGPATLGFQLQVCDTHGSCASDSVTITVRSQYQIVGFFSPFPQSKWKAGTTVPVKIGLAQNGTRLSDAAAAALASQCRVTFSAASQPAFGPACMKYDATTHQFLYTWKIASNTSQAANVLITVKVLNAGGSTNISLTEPITITGK